MLRHKKFITKLLVLIFVAMLTVSCVAVEDNLPEHTAVNRNFYQIFVGSFYDSNGDGSGDLQGIIHQLDYLNNGTGEDSLGINGIWLTPIHPSPTYHKYDVMDYYAIDPKFGTMEDFEQLVAECNERNISLIMDLVLNHTSSRHPWFLAALEEIRNDSEPFYRDFYIFTEERLGAGYYPTVGGLFYKAHFWGEMPDLNMDNEHLRAEVVNIVKFWLDKGVAGFRLDAVMHVYDSLSQNVEFWTWFVDICKEIKEDVFLVGEVWSNEQVIMSYFPTGLSLFNFPFSGHDGTIARSINNGSGARLATELERYYNEMRMRHPDVTNCMFLSNHDTGRSAGFLIDPNKRRLAAAIYLLAPGNPFIYYGEEIGMTGTGIDENKRTAMLWSTTDETGMTRNPAGTTNTNRPDEGVAEQLLNPDSLLNYYRAIIRLKANHQDIFDGVISKVDIENTGICAIQVGNVIVLHNLTDESIEINTNELGKSLSGFVSPTGEQATVSRGVLTLPPWASAVLS